MEPWCLFNPGDKIDLPSREPTVLHGMAAIACLTSVHIVKPNPQVPEHLREDFCGTALLASTWCRGDVARRTAMGLDIDRDALMWGLQHNGEGLADTAQPCLWLMQGDVRQPLDKATLIDGQLRKPDSQACQPSIEQGMQSVSLQAPEGTAASKECSSSMRDDLRHPEQHAESDRQDKVVSEHPLHLQADMSMSKNTSNTDILPLHQGRRNAYTGQRAERRDAGQQCFRCLHQA